jgi:hypothetical protein
VVGGARLLATTVSSTTTCLSTAVCCSQPDSPGFYRRRGDILETAYGLLTSSLRPAGKTPRRLAGDVQATRDGCDASVPERSLLSLRRRPRSPRSSTRRLHAEGRRVAPSQAETTRPRRGRRPGSVGARRPANCRGLGPTAFHVPSNPNRSNISAADTAIVLCYHQ